MPTPPDFTAGSVLTAAQMNAIGLWLITPTSVAGTGVTLSGAAVNFSSSTSISVNGCFSADWTNYRIVVTGTSTADTDAVFRFRASGSDTATNVYQFASQGYFGAARNDASGTALSAISFTPSFGSGRTSGASIEVYRPYTTDSWKATNANVTFMHSAVGVIVRNVAGGCNSATQFDGFTFSAGNNMTGQLFVYGYRD